MSAWSGVCGRRQRIYLHLQEGFQVRGVETTQTKTPLGTELSDWE